MQTTKLVTVASCLTVLGLLIAGCTPAAGRATSEPSAPTELAAKPAPSLDPRGGVPTASLKAGAEQPRYGGTLNISHMGDPGSFDPIQESTIQVHSLVMPSYSGIVQFDPLEQTRVIGDLAEKWEVSPDGMAYTFHLYSNVKWHDGTPLTAEDARFTLETVRRPPRGVVSPRREWLKAADKIEALDKNTLKITLQFPTGSFLGNLADGRMAVVPKHVFEEKGNMRKDVVGSGPYKFKSFTPGSTFSVVKNPEYFVKGRPYLDGITWYIIPDVATRYAALRTHRVQATPLTAGGLTPSQAETIRKEMSDSISVERYPGFALFVFAMLHTKAPWSDIRVRRAVELSIDRPNLIKASTAAAADFGGFMPPGAWSLPEAELKAMPGYRQPKDADMAESKRLMAEAGYGDGIKTTLVTSSHPLYERPAVAVKEQLGQIGIDITINLKDQATFTDQYLKRAFDTTVYVVAASADDPDQIFGQSFITGVPRNASDFSDDKVDKWYDEQARIFDMGKRKQIVLDMQRRLHELIPSSPLFWASYELGYWREVKDYRAGVGTKNHNLKFQNVWLAG